VAFAVDMKNPYNQKFVEKYNSRFKELPNENAHNGYIAAYVAKEVLELAASVAREKVREAFTKVHITDGPGAGEGPIKFDPDGELSNPQGILTQNLGGKPVTVWPSDVAASKAVYPMPK
jgi:branched-chain amino acid transport system substrate-binding protein